MVAECWRMTTLRQNFIRELVIRGMSLKTHEAYIGAVYRLAKYYKKSPDQISDEELKNYVFHLASDRKLSASSLNQNVSAFRLFYETVLQRSMEQVRRAVPRVNRAIHRPQVFSVEELEQLFTVGCPFPKHRAFLMTVYGAGLRLSEACQSEDRASAPLSDADSGGARQGCQRPIHLALT